MNEVNNSGHCFKLLLAKADGNKGFTYLVYDI